MIVVGDASFPDQDEKVSLEWNLIEEKREGLIFMPKPSLRLLTFAIFSVYAEDSNIFWRL